jgi:hypothetical protein
MSQAVLAAAVERTEDWLSKVENNRIAVDRLSVIRSLAVALDVALGDLLAEPSLLHWTPDSGQRTVPALRAALMDYRALVGAVGPDREPERVNVLTERVDQLWRAYQDGRFGYVTGIAPRVLPAAQLAVEAETGPAQDQARAVLALTYQVAASTLTKVGETDLAWIAADRGLASATTVGDPLVLCSLYRTVVHSLGSNGRYEEASAVVELAADRLRGQLDLGSARGLSVHGSLFLAGSMTAARSGNRSLCTAFLDEADAAARILGRDGNHMWTAFGPTNVAIHRVATAMELGDVQVAVDLGQRVDATGLPVERQVRHALEVARALSGWNRVEQAVATVLAAEQLAPEQVRYHFITRHLVQSWMRSGRGRPSYQLTGLAQRIGVA